MLSKPQAGWCDITIKNQCIGCASYLDDVPDILLDEFIRSLRDMATNKDIPIHLQFSLDAEGYNFGCVVWDDELYAINTASNTPPYLNITHIETDDIKTAIIALAQEMYVDIKNNIDDWAAWNTDSDEEDNIIVYKQQYLNKLSELNALIMLNKILYGGNE